ncbi:MAG: hypothetical protein ACRD1K_17765 [Acidimicrobiales bacterium]
MILVGRVISGSGDLGRWMTTFADAYTAAAGAPLHPGSLNIVLEQPWPLPSGRISLSADLA